MFRFIFLGFFALAISQTSLLAEQTEACTKEILQMKRINFMNKLAEAQKVVPKEDLDRFFAQSDEGFVSEEFKRHSDYLYSFKDFKSMPPTFDKSLCNGFDSMASAFQGLIEKY